MAWAFQDSGIYFSGWDNGAAPVTVSVNEGDLIVVGWGTEETADVPNGVSDEDGNSYTLGTLRNSNDGMLLMLAYATAKSTNGTCTITATYSAGNGGMRGITAMVFTPDAGDTFELEDNSYVESGFVTGEIPTASDLSAASGDVVCAAFYIGASDAIDYSNQEIPNGTGATMAEDAAGTGMMCGFYRLLVDTALTNEEAAVDTDVTAFHCGEVYAFKATAAGADELTATEIATGAPILATPTIGQTHALAASEIATGAPTLATSAIGQTHALAATEIATGAPTLETPTVGTAGTDALTATEIATGAPTLATPTLGQTHALTATEIATGAPTIATPTIGQTHKLTATEIATAAPTLATPTAGQAHALTAAAIATGAPALAVPTIGQIHALTATEIATGAPSLDTPTLAQIHALVASAIATGAPELGTPTVDAAIHQELVLVEGVFTQLETVTGALTQLETVTGAFTQTVTVSGKLLEED